MVWCGQVVDYQVDFVEIVFDGFDGQLFYFVGESVVIDVVGIQVFFVGEFFEGC